MLDAGVTPSLNNRRALFFSWACTVFPLASGMPEIKAKDQAIATVENLAIGEYKFQLTVKDNFGNIHISSYQLEVLQDSLEGKIPIAKAGPDQQINAPMNNVMINASETYNFNPLGRSLNFKWTIIEKPLGINMASITNNTFSITHVNLLTVGNYKIQLEVKNDVGLSAYDTVEINVLPDPLKGTVRIFENELWERIQDDWSDYIAIVIYEGDLFINRTEDNMEVRVWDEEKKEWADSKKFVWYADESGRLFIYYPGIEDIGSYYKFAGTKTKVQVKFL